MPIGGEMTVWCEPSERKVIKLISGDVKRALSWFMDTTGQGAKLIVLHPKNERFVKEVPEGVAVEYVGGCLSWEVWLSMDNSFVLGDKTGEGYRNVPSANLLTSETRKFEVNKLNSVTPKVTRREKPGPKAKALPEELIKELASQGLGYKAIASKLRAEGYKVSFMTVQRRLQGVLV